jgi:hypothetical protein
MHPQDFEREEDHEEIDRKKRVNCEYGLDRGNASTYGSFETPELEVEQMASSEDVRASRDIRPLPR